MNTYKQLTLVLDQLYNMSLSAPSISTSPNSSYCQESSSFRPTEVKSEVKLIFLPFLCFISLFPFFFLQKSCEYSTGQATLTNDLRIRRRVAAHSRLRVDVKQRTAGRPNFYHKSESGKLLDENRREKSESNSDFRFTLEILREEFESRSCSKNSAQIGRPKRVGAVNNMSNLSDACEANYFSSYFT